jgi:hypothetical protein
MEAQDPRHPSATERNGALKAPTRPTFAGGTGL